MQCDKICTWRHGPKDVGIERAQQVDGGLQNMLNEVWAQSRTDLKLSYLGGHFEASLDKLLATATLYAHFHCHAFYSSLSTMMLLCTHW